MRRRREELGLTRQQLADKLGVSVSAVGNYETGVSAPKGISYIYGLGGRDVRVESIQHVFAELAEIAATGVTGETYRYLDVRE